MGKFADLHEALEQEPDAAGHIHTATSQRKGGVKHDAKVKPVGSKFRVTHFENDKYTGKANDRHFDTEHEAKEHANLHVQRASAKL